MIRVNNFAFYATDDNPYNIGAFKGTPAKVRDHAAQRKRNSLKRGVKRALPRQV
jgi:hypothetical protein